MAGEFGPIIVDDHIISVCLKSWTEAFGVGYPTEIKIGLPKEIARTVLFPTIFRVTEYGHKLDQIKFSARCTFAEVMKIFIFLADNLVCDSRDFRPLCDDILRRVNECAAKSLLAESGFDWYGQRKYTAARIRRFMPDFSWKREIAGQKIDISFVLSYGWAI